jgi:hypothetical protein
LRIIADHLRASQRSAITNRMTDSNQWLAATTVAGLDC